MALKDEIKKIRLRNSMTQSDLAKLLGVTQASISGWERGISDPEDFRLQEIAKLGNISIETLKNTNENLVQKLEQMIKDVSVAKIVAGDEYLQGRLDTLEEVLEEIEKN